MTAEGQLVHPDHQKWISEQVSAAGGSSAAAHRALRDRGLLLTECELTALFFVVDRGGAQDNFVQLRVLLENEYVDRPAIAPNPWSPIRDEQDLREATGDPFQGEERRRWTPPGYVLGQVFDAAVFMGELDVIDSASRKALAQRRYQLTDAAGAVENRTHADLDPDFDRFPHKARRLFDDWSSSSAGASGARLCEHWVLQISDYTNDDGRRYLDVIPMWAFNRPLAEIHSQRGSDYELMGKLEKLDARVGVPFAWYFFMLHGNRVREGAGLRVLRAAERGLIVLPERDYQVLKRWERRSYGF